MHSFLWLIFYYISVYHSFFIHSSVDGHLGCFHVLAIVNSTAVNIRVNVSFRIMVFWGYMPSSGIAGSYGSFIPSFWETSMLFSIVAVSVYIPTTVQEGSLFSISSIAFIFCRYFDDGNSDQCDVIPLCSFDLHFSNNKQFWISSQVSISHLHVFFGAMSV